MSCPVVHNLCMAVEPESSVGDMFAGIASEAGKRQDESARMLGITVGFVLLCLSPLAFTYLLRFLGIPIEDGFLQTVGMLATIGGITWYGSSLCMGMTQRARERLEARLAKDFRESDVQSLAMEEEVWLRLKELMHGSWAWRAVIPDLPMTPQQQLRAAATVHPALMCIARSEHGKLRATAVRCLLGGMLARFWNNDCLGCVIFPLLPVIMIGSPVVLPVMWLTYSCQARINLTLMAYCRQYD